MGPPTCIVSGRFLSHPLSYPLSQLPQPQKHHALAVRRLLAMRRRTQTRHLAPPKALSPMPPARPAAILPWLHRRELELIEFSYIDTYGGQLV
jgi:hypothetical protein